MITFEYLTGDLYLLKVPFLGNFTSVFLVNRDEPILIDCASNASDVDNYILPALDALGVEPVYLLISHDHGDHSGGLARIRERLPNLKVGMNEPREGCFKICDNDEFSGIRVLELPGHSADSVGFYDTSTKTLISCDCLQQKGIGIYGTILACRDEYFASIDKVRALDCERIYAAHPYFPIGQEVRGDWCALLLDSCEQTARELLEFTKARRGKSYEEIASEYARLNPGQPKISPTLL